MIYNYITIKLYKYINYISISVNLLVIFSVLPHEINVHTVKPKGQAQVK